MQLLEEQAADEGEAATLFGIEYQREVFRWAAEQTQAAVQGRDLASVLADGCRRRIDRGRGANAWQIAGSRADCPLSRARQIETTCRPIRREPTGPGRIESWLHAFTTTTGSSSNCSRISWRRANKAMSPSTSKSAPTANRGSKRSRKRTLAGKTSVASCNRKTKPPGATPVRRLLSGLARSCRRREHRVSQPERRARFARSIRPLRNQRDPRPRRDGSGHARLRPGAGSAFGDQGPGT